MLAAECYLAARRGDDTDEAMAWALEEVEQHYQVVGFFRGLAEAGQNVKP